MPSEALANFCDAINEVKNLEKANPTPVGSAPTKPEITRAIGRASVVLLTSHFERYFRAANEEVSDYLADLAYPSDRLPESLRLLHSKAKIDQLSETAWERSARSLREFFAEDGWLWGGAPSGKIIHNRLLVWMKSPRPADLRRYYRYWGIDDIFSAITRKRRTRNHLWLKVQELVDKRNNIAHGDALAGATQKDVRDYTKAVSDFCNRADAQLAKQIGKLLDVARPW